MPSRLSFSVLSVAETVEAYVWNIPDGWICPVRWVFYNKRRLAPGAPGRGISPLWRQGQGFALRGEVLSQRESTQRIAGERLRMSAFALIFALSPDPFYGGYSPNSRWSSSGAWNLEWTVPTPAGPLGPGAVDSGRGWSSPPAPPTMQPTLQGGGGHHPPRPTEELVPHRIQRRALKRRNHYTEKSTCAAAAVGEVTSIPTPPAPLRKPQEEPNWRPS